MGGTISPEYVIHQTIVFHKQKKPPFSHGCREVFCVINYVKMLFSTAKNKEKCFLE
jgi:hypothetical protein